MADRVLHYIINNPLELNLSYMPFIVGGGLFIPTNESFQLGDFVDVNLELAVKNENIMIEGKVVWLTPKNALHHVIQGVGVQFIGENAVMIRAQVEVNLTLSMEVGGYTYGITDATNKR
jgi:type IV pilus assembly protein PilZ